MRFAGKIIGFFIGYMFGGLGGILGLTIGHLYDVGVLQRWWQRFLLVRVVRSKETGDVFFKEVFSLMGYVAKCDGRVSRPEIEAVERVMGKMSLRRKQRKAAILYFRQGKLSAFEADESLTRLANAYSSQTSMLRMAYDILESVAKADNPVLSGARKGVMQMIGRAFGMQQQFSFDDFFEQFRRAAGSGYQQTGGSSSSSVGSVGGVASAYRTLDMKRDASDGEVKKRYRQLMSRYHPDKMIAQKKSKEEIAKATEKTQGIKKAYETICRARGAS